MKPIRIITILFLSGALFLTGCNKEKGDDTHETYSITVKSGDNGSASANVTEAEAGATITLLLRQTRVMSSPHGLLRPAA